ncbi:hypothetical protein CROQUDRAFT_657660 [Cronartium quercuum f. sp. fusiforme G11]|uniref:Uncharacterized protein n=1 Tax=Cronartium quercuum f. sp. fusiforme G11 TaxID=708437 RepID=A0A9P6TBZ9_9BASI|nr:hypothetical protein CROQUDRAFT_657660 [Cronartium quercuum f. sp. fusiforme G11]
MNLILFVSVFILTFSVVIPSPVEPDRSSQSLRTREIPFGPILKNYQSLLDPIEKYRLSLLPGNVDVSVVVKGLIDLEVKLGNVVRNSGLHCDCTPPVLELHLFRNAIVVLFAKLQGIITVLKTVYSPHYLASVLDVFARIRVDLKTTLSLALDVGINLDDIIRSLDINLFLDVDIDLLNLIKINLPIIVDL